MRMSLNSSISRTSMNIAVPDESVSLVVADEWMEPLDGLVPAWVLIRIQQAEARGLIPLSVAVLWHQKEVRVVEMETLESEALSINLVEVFARGNAL